MSPESFVTRSVMPTRLPPFRSIEAFVVTAQALNFTTAANSLHLTPSAISRRILALEEDLGAQLLSRTPRAVRLTPAGERYLSELAPALDMIRAATAEVRTKTASESLRISAPAAFAANWLIPRLWKFERLHRSIPVSIDTQGSNGQSVVDADIAIRFGTERCGGRCEELLMGGMLFPVCSPDFLRRNSRLQSLKGLDQFSLLGLGQYPDLWDQWLNRAECLEAKRNSYVCYDDFFVLYEAAVGGAGIAIGIDVMVDSYLGQGRLVRISPIEHSSSEKIYASRNTPSSRITPAFLFWLREEAEQWCIEHKTLAGDTPA